MCYNFLPIKVICGLGLSLFFTWNLKESDLSFMFIYDISFHECYFLHSIFPSFFYMFFFIFPFPIMSYSTLLCLKIQCLLSQVISTYALVCLSFEIRSLLGSHLRYLHDLVFTQVISGKPSLQSN